MEFEVNGHNYFLTFAEDERRWCVFEPTATGTHRIPIYVDVPKYDVIGILESGRHKISN